MATSWNTKWGVRRVRVELPTLDEALDAAAGLSDDPTTQVRMAADLMDKPLADISAEAHRLLRTRLRRPQLIRSSSGRTAVTVERKIHKRVLRPVQS